MPVNPTNEVRQQLVKLLRDDANALIGEEHPGLNLSGLRMDLNRAASEIDNLDIALIQIEHDRVRRLRHDIAGLLNDFLMRETGYEPQVVGTMTSSNPEYLEMSGRVNPTDDQPGLFVSFRVKLTI